MCFIAILITFYPVGWGCRIRRLILCRGVRSYPQNACPVYDTKQSDGEVPVMIDLWGMQSTSLLPSLPGLLWLRVVAPDKFPIYGLNRTKLLFLDFTAYLCQTELLEIELLCHLNCVLILNWIIWNKTDLKLTLCIAQSVGAVEYTDCTFAEGYGQGPITGINWTTLHIFC